MAFFFALNMWYANYFNCLHYTICNRTKLLGSWNALLVAKYSHCVQICVVWLPTISTGDRIKWQRNISAVVVLIFSSGVDKFHFFFNAISCYFFQWYFSLNILWVYINIPSYAFHFHSFHPSIQLERIVILWSYSASFVRSRKTNPSVSNGFFFSRILLV